MKLICVRHYFKRKEQNINKAYCKEKKKNSLVSPSCFDLCLAQ